MKSWIGPTKQAVVAIVSLSLIHTTVPQPADSSPRPYHARAGQPSSLPFGPSRIPDGVATKSATIEVNPELRASSVKVVNGSNSNPARHLTPPFDDQKRSAIRPARPNALPKGSGRTDLTALGPHGLSFVENRGQWDERVRFQLKSGAKTLWLTNDGVVFDNVRAKTNEHPSASAEPGSIRRVPIRQFPDAYERLVFSEDFTNANSAPSIETIAVQPGKYNYIVGSDPAKWHTGVLSYDAVVYHNVWDGVDVKVAKNGADIEQEFVVHPGADLSRVQIVYRGIDGLEIAKDGSLLVHTAYGDLQESAPRIYQEIAGNRVSVAGRFTLTNKTSYTFKVESADPQYALVIDPTLLYSTFLGGSVGFGCGPFFCDTGESARAIAVDAAGNAYMTGFTQSLDFPTTPGAFQTSGAFQTAALVTKLNTTGSQLVYSTYLAASGGSSGTYGYGIALDSAQEPYITGTNAQGPFPTTSNAYQQACAYGGSFFLTKMNATGDGLIYSTCFGLNYFSHAYAIAVDSSGKAYIVGNDTTGGLPTTSAAYQPTYTGASGYGGDAFLSVFDPSKSGAASLVYSTYLGGSNDDQGYAVAVDGFGMAYVTGYTSSQNFPVTPGAFQTTYPGAVEDVFVAKFNPSASGAASLIYSTYLGGNGKTVIAGVAGSDIANSIAVDSLGQAHVTGAAESVDFPITSGAFQTSAKTFHNAFVSTLNAAGDGLVQSTFFGGSSGDIQGGAAIALDFSGNNYIAGTTSAVDLPTTAGAFQSAYGGGGFDAFVAELNAPGTALLYSSYLGGAGVDQAYGIAVDTVGDAYVTGFTESFNFPVTQGAFQPVINSGGAAGPADAFVTKLPLSPTKVLSIAGILPNNGGNVGVLTATIVGSGFHQGASVSLSGASSIIASPANIATGGRTITATFDLHGAVAGGRDLTVTNPDGTTFTVANAFTVTNGGGPNLWVQLVGRAGISSRFNSNFDIVVGNQGNVDAVGVSVTLSGIPSNWSVSPDFPITVPPPIAGAAPIDWSTVPVVVNSDSPPQKLIPLFLPFVPPNTIVDLHFSVNPNNNLLPAQLQASVGSPFFQSPMSPPAINCLLSIAGTAASAVGVGAALNPGSPGFAAVGRLLASQFLAATKVGYGYSQGLTSGGKIIFSMAQMLVGITVAGLVAAGIVSVPVGAIVAAISAGISLALTLIACQPVFNSVLSSLLVAVLAAHDPNEKLGVVGVGPQKYLSGVGAIPYSILFENETTATAPAQQVIVTDAVDPGLDLTTLSLGPVTINGYEIPFSATFAPGVGLNETTSNLDLRPDLNLVVTVDAKLNPTTRIMTWTFSSFDPSTGQLPTDPTIGFLAPGMEGSVFFTANPVPGLGTGTQISNQASVVFDNLAPILTLPWTNTLDNTRPTSQVAALPPNATSTNFMVAWSGTDVGSGIQDYTVYVSDNGGAYTAFQTNTTTTSATFTGQLNHTYGFYSIARDLVGNVEDAKSAAEASTQVVQGIADNIPPITTASVSPPPNTAGWNNSNVTVSMSSVDNSGGSGVRQITYGIAGAQTVASTTVTGSSVPVSISTEGISTITFFATDNAGNVESTHTLTIRLDKTPPAFATFPASVTVPPASPAGAVVTYILPTATDAISGVSTIGVSCVPASGSTFPLGATTVTCTVADNAGNVATANFSVTVSANYSFKWIIGKPAPALNSAEVSDEYKVAFSLGGNFGLNVVTAVTSTSIACNGPKGTGLPEAEGRLGLSYNSTTGNYQEAFAKAGAHAAGTCLQINLTLNDGTTQAINVKYVK